MVEKMSSAYLNKYQVDLLFQYIEKNNSIYKCIKKSEKDKLFGSKLRIDFNESEKGEFLDELTLLLTSIGLDANSEINERGIVIEEIIDQILGDEFNN